MKLQLIASLAALSLLASCGGGGKSTNKFKRSAGEPLTADSPMVMPSYNFSEGMGLLHIRKPGELSVCTSFMISENQLMTNSHCLQDISLTENCSNNVVVHVKTAQNGFEFHRCRRIISRSKLDGDFNDPDFAVIELDSPTKAKAMTLSREGVQELAELTVESVDYSGSSENIYANRKISKCTPHANSAIGTFTQTKSSIIPIFGDVGQTCHIIHGNSGSPVKNASGNVVSVLFATIDTDALRTRLNVKNPREAALATNLACIKTGVAAFDALRARECDQIVREESQYMARLEAQYETGKDENRRAKSEELKRNLPGAFKFDLVEKRESKVEDKEKYSFNFNANCMHSPSTWSEDEKLKIRTENGLRRYSTSVGIFSYGMNLQFDEHLRPQVESVLTKTDYYELIVENIDATEPLVKVKIAKYENGRLGTTEKQIPRCLNR